MEIKCNGYRLLINILKRNMKIESMGPFKQIEPVRLLF